MTSERARWGRVLLAVAAVVASVAAGHAAFADGAAEDDELFHAGVARLGEGKPGEAIADFEALADRGVVDATVSFDRGLAYVARVRVGGEQPGDLGEAAHAFVEARELAADGALAKEASRALSLVRTEVGRRRARAGEPVEFDPGLALGPTFLRLLPEDGWALLAVVGSVALGLALFVWRAAAEQRTRIAAIATGAFAAALVLVGTVTTFAARHQRMTATRGVIVTAGVRPTDEKGVVTPSAPIVPEAADVDILARRAGWAQIRWGNLVAWIPAGAVRAIAEP